LGGVLARKKKWPSWWDWELELSPHLFKRMVDRQFGEVELRKMLEHAKGYRADIMEGRWVVDVAHQGERWEVIVEPDDRLELLVVVTAYPLEEQES